MERASISIDALVSMILIITLVASLQSLVSAQQDYVNSYGSVLQGEYLAMQYGSMINNYYTLKADTGLIVDTPTIKIFSKELRQEPTFAKQDSNLVFNTATKPEYPIPSDFKLSNLIVVKK